MKWTLSFHYHLLNDIKDHNTESKPNMKDIHEGAYKKKKRRMFLASLPWSSIGQKRIVGLKN
jgi:hypothetical protein